MYYCPSWLEQDCGEGCLLVVSLQAFCEERARSENLTLARMQVRVGRGVEAQAKLDIPFLKQPGRGWGCFAPSDASSCLRGKQTE